MAGKRTEMKSEDLNLVPIMNLVTLLIPFLLLSAAYVQIGVIDVQSPRFGSGSSQQDEMSDPNKPKLTLTVFITDQGFTVAATGGVLGGGGGGDAAESNTSGPTIPKKDGEYDYQSLTKKMVEIKDAFPDERQIILSAEADIHYEFLIKVMDSCRESEDGKLLFDQVVISTGIA